MHGESVGLGVAIFGLLWLLGFRYAHCRAASKAVLESRKPSLTYRIMAAVGLIGGLPSAAASAWAAGCWRDVFCGSWRP